MKVCPICRSHHEDSITCAQHELTTEDILKTPSDLIPGFRLVTLLESGQSSELHHAVESSSGRSCLIRLISTDESGSRQLLREAKLAGNIFHPSIAGFYEAGQLDDGSCFLVSEELDGRSLREILDNVGTPELLDAIEIVRLAAEALHALHLAGLVHGAVSPSNIIVSPGTSGSGMVHVQHPDLGRVRQRSIISNRFLIDNELDSLRYFSPEQCDGEDPVVQSDVYSLGLVFYEMVAGVPPFDAATAVALIHQHKNQPPPDIRIENFNLRMLVTHALTEALQKQSRLRQSSANTFSRQLRHIEQLATHTSTPPPAGTVSHVPPAAITPVLPSTAPIRKVHAAEMIPSLPEVASHQRRPDPPPTPEITEEPKVVEIEDAEVIRNEVMPVDTPISASAREVRGRMISVEEALEESYATLTSLVTPPAQRPSRLQALKKKLNVMTSLFSPGKAAPHEPQPDGVIQRTDSIAEQSPTRVPKKIEWVQPDDDIPSIDDVQQVLALEQEMPLSISTLESGPEPILASAAELEIEHDRNVPTKIEWAQADDDIPSIDDVQEVLAREDEMPLPLSASESEPEPIIASTPEPAIEPARRAPKKIEWFEDEHIRSIDEVQELLAKYRQMQAAISTVEPDAETEIIPEPAREIEQPSETEPQIIHVEPSPPAPAVMVAEAASSEPQEPVVELTQPEPEIIHVALATPERDAIHVESSISEPEEVVAVPVPVAAVPKRRKKSRRKPVELVVAPPPTDPEAIHAESAASEPQEIVVEPQLAVPEVVHAESAASKPQEIVVEPPQSDPEVILVEPAQSEPQEIIVELPQPEPEVIHVEPAQSDEQELVAEPPQSEPEVIHVESALSEPQEIVVEPPQPDPVVIEAETVEPAREIVAVAALRSESPKVLRGIRRSAVAVVRKRHKKLARSQSLEVVVKPLHSEPEVIQLEPAFSDPQELVVEPPRPVEPAFSEPQELVVEPTHSEPEVIHAESAESEPQELIVEPPQSEPETIQVEPAQSEPQELIVEPPQPDQEMVHVASEPQELVVEPPKPEPEVIHVKPIVSEVQEVVVEPAQPEAEVVQAEPTAPAPDIIGDSALPSEPAKPAPVVTQFAVVTKRRKKSSHRQPIVISKPLSADDEEITVVRARSKRVRIHMSPQAAPRRSQPTIRRRSPVPAEIEFVPTLLGRGVEPPSFVAEQSDTMFAAYSAESSRPISRHRSHLIGGGIIALLALVLFGADTITRYFQTWSAADSMTADATRRAETKPLLPATTRPIISQPIVEKPVVDKPVVDKPVADKKDRTTPKAKVSVAPDTRTSIPHESLMKIMIPIPSRGSSAGARLATDNAVQKRISDRTTTPKAGPLTRPRVVQDPDK